MKRTSVYPTVGAKLLPRRRASAVALAVALTSLTGGAQAPPIANAGRIAPGITVLLEDSVGLIRGKRVGLLTNQTGVDQAGVEDAVLLTRSSRAVQAQVRLTILFSPEHGLRGTEDRQFVEGGVDGQSGVPVYSLYGATVMPPPDSLLAKVDVLVIDLQDIGTRTWTYVASMLYAMRASARLHLPVVVLDRPNPLTGVGVEGPMLDSALADPDPSVPGRPARPYALAPIPLRHGLTMGELARYYNDVLSVQADLHVVPARNWRRDLWFDETGLPWVQPSPNMPTLASAVVYPALVAFEGSNLSVGRGTPDPFQRFGAPWLDVARVAALLGSRRLPGVQFDTETFTPDSPTDRKFGGQRLAGIRIRVTERNAFQSSRVGAAILWAVAAANGDSLRLDTTAFDLRFGSPAARRALVRGGDPDAVLEVQFPAVAAFVRRTRQYTLYH